MVPAKQTAAGYRGDIAIDDFWAANLSQVVKDVRLKLNHVPIAVDDRMIQT
jgi:hypothetical protein